jgi:uncharacterized membrane protein YphA (DoxX/SURF4 family)
MVFPQLADLGSCTQGSHRESAPRICTQKSHPESAPRNRTQKVHPEFAPRNSTQNSHPEFAPIFSCVSQIAAIAYRRVPGTLARFEEPRVKTIMREQNIHSQTEQQATGSPLTLFRSRASSAARFLLASVFLLSGISKLYAPASASTFVATILPITADAARIMVIPLSLSEVAAACLLLFNKWVTMVASFSTLFFLSAFVIGLFYLGEDKPCGCFGDLLASQTDQWFVLRSLALLILSLFVLRSHVPQSIVGSPSK